MIGPAATVTQNMMVLFYSILIYSGTVCRCVRPCGADFHNVVMQ